MRIALHPRWWIAAVCSSSLSLAAESPVLVKDLHTGVEGGSYPPSPVRAGDLVFFCAAAGGSGFELWKSDGTAGGTQLTRDIRPGAASSGPRELMGAGSLCYLVANDGEHGAELWRSDGTGSGTLLLADALPPGTDRAPFALTAAGERLHYFVEPPASDVELWTSDGRPDGTRRVRALPEAGDRVPPRALGVAGGLFYFTTTVDQDLWRTDGTPGGTVRLRDVEGELEIFEPTAAAALGGHLYFFARFGDGFQELLHALWRSDGTPGGTIATGWTASGRPRETLEEGGQLFFAFDTVDDEIGVVASAIWKSDGTQDGTRQVRRFNVAEGDYTPRSLIGARERLYFWGGQQESGKNQVWVTDGSEAGTEQLRELTAFPGPLVAAGEHIYFVATPLGGGAAVWRTDGTEPGTTLETTLAAGQLDVAADGLVPLQDAVLFHLHGPPLGRELWIADGAAPGARRVRGGFDLRGKGSAPRELSSLDEQLVFIASEFPRTDILWGSDGTSAGTLPLLAPAPGGSISLGETAAAGEALYFTLSAEGDRYELWQTDGTVPGTRRTSTLPGDGYQPRSLTAVGERLFFIHGEAFGADELWQHGGTPASTTRLEARLDRASELTPFGSLLLFHDTPGAPRLWRSDGTAEGTITLRSFVEGEDFSYTRSLTPLGVQVFFVLDTSSLAGGELWTTDGTVEGTRRIRAFPDGPDVQRLQSLAAAGDTLYLFFARLNSGTEVWTSDGTGPGTTLLRALSVDPPGFDSPVPASLGDLLVFAADDGTGEQLWRSDGTRGGTYPLTAVRNERNETQPQQLFALGAKVYFSLHDDEHGRELWETDGSPAGTRRLSDLLAGPEDSWPQSLHGHRGRLYFAADDGAHGAELWTLREGDPVLRGDVNRDRLLNLTDAVGILNCLFRGATDCSPELCARDSNADGQVNISDPVYLLVHLFLGGPGLAACP